MSEAPSSHLDSTLGAGFIGVVAAATIYGVTNVQTYIYYRQCQDDPIWYQRSIFLLWIMDTLHQVLITHVMYTYAVTNFGNAQALQSPTWSLMAHVLVTGTSDVIIRSLFCLRLWKLHGKNRIMVFPIMVFAILSWAGSIVFSLRGLVKNNFAALDQISWDLFMSMSANIAADTLLAASLVVSLWRLRTGIPRIDSIVHVLMLYSINTGVLTSVFALLCFIMLAIMPGNFVYLAILFLLPKLLLNAFLAILNARQSLHQADAMDFISLPAFRACASQITTHTTTLRESGLAFPPDLRVLEASENTAVKPVDNV
ncbi:hypothetical protein OBBRIDRAFT_620742 [Obba rivulosa]|uniref:DUF6534 domain-containing protein n=1 Tax=Obba rivulosa TaxID=1052685 RepID=A0A8E2ATS0_9APHY|nr:hypothetical protein OBBRIDRAFT_620742 [Obba rivulosa]